MLIFNDLSWDRKLNISTVLPDYIGMDRTNYGYDPTPYFALERLVDRGWIKHDDVILDYGCGKGRVGFFLNKKIGCKVIGIDHNKRRLKSAKKNLKSYGDNRDIEFFLSKAEDFNPSKANCFYFFNPFSVRIFQKVLNRISASRKTNPREVYIFFYYSTKGYRSFFNKYSNNLLLVDEIDCTTKLSRNKSLYRILVFRLK